MLRYLLCAGLFVAFLAALTGCQDRPVPTGRAIGTAPEGRGTHSAVEFVTGVVTLREGDTITVHVLNFSDTEQPCAIEIYRDSREGAREVGKNDGYKVRSRAIASSRFTVKNPGEYWVLVKGETSLLAPQATFASAEGDRAAASVVYKPGDFLKAQTARSSVYGPPTTEVARPKTSGRASEFRETSKAPEPKATEKK
jgi:hypothetical protein